MNSNVPNSIDTDITVGVSPARWGSRTQEIWHFTPFCRSHIERGRFWSGQGQTCHLQEMERGEGELKSTTVQLSDKGQCTTSSNLHLNSLFIGSPAPPPPHYCHIHVYIIHRDFDLFISCVKTGWKQLSRIYRILMQTIQLGVWYHH